MSSVAKRLVHTREFTCHGYLRDDGLMEIEGHMRDLSVGETDLPFYSLEAGAAIHDMRLVMTLDDDLVIRQVRAITDSGATPYCAAIDTSYAVLQGLKIGKGFKRQVRDLVGGTRGCTHLTELAVSTLANAAIQLSMAVRRERRRAGMAPTASESVTSMIIDTCHAYRRDGEAIKMLLPRQLRKRAQDPR